MQNPKRILRPAQGSISKVNCFFGQKSILHHYCIQNVEHGIHIRVYKFSIGSVTHFNQFVSVKVRKILRKPQALFRES